MPKNLTQVDVFDNPVQAPLGPESRSAASVELPYQQLTNRSYNNKLRLDNVKNLNSYNGFFVPIFGGSTHRLGAGDDPAWIPDVAGAAFLVNAQNSSFGLNRWDIAHLIPTVGTITNITVYLEGNAGSGGPHVADVVGLPVFDLTRVSPDGQTTTTIAGPFTDPSANFTAYDATHTITSGALSLAITANDRYVITLVGEFSTNSLPDALGLHAITIDWTVP